MPCARVCSENAGRPTEAHLHKKDYAEANWAEGPIIIARMTSTIKLDRNWNSFQLANSAPPLSVPDNAIAPSARMIEIFVGKMRL